MRILIPAVMVAVVLLALGALIGRWTAPDPTPSPDATTQIIDGYRAGDDISNLVPLHKGDIPGAFKDVTQPDGTKVPAGKKVEKTWSMTNAGTVPWKGRSMVRTTPFEATGAKCTTPKQVPIPDTPPGKTAEITVPVTLTDTSGNMCRVEWKMLDEDGNSAFPNGRPIYFLLEVA